MKRQPGPQKDVPTAIRQAASLLDQGRRLLEDAATEVATAASTAARVRRLPIHQLRRDPVLWAAYNRGWEDFRRTVQNQEPLTPVGHSNRRRAASRSPTATTRGTGGPTAVSQQSPSTSVNSSQGPARVGSSTTVATFPTTVPRPRAAVSPHPVTTEWTGMPQPAGWWEQDNPTTGLGPLDRLPPRPTAPPAVSPSQPPPLPPTANHHQRRNRQRLEAFLAKKRTATKERRQLGGKVPSPTPPLATHPVPPTAPEPMDTEGSAPGDETSPGHTNLPEAPNTAESAVPGSLSSRAEEEVNDTFYTATPPTSPRSF